jgi:hypothetical protein
LYTQHGFSLMPESVQVIVRTFPRAEDVHDDVAVIEQEPAGVRRAFHMMGQDALPFQAFFNIIEDSLYLPLAVTVADNKIVREAANLADIQ